MKNQWIDLTNDLETGVIIDYIEDRDAIVAQIEFSSDVASGDVIKVTASSKRDPSDKFDIEVGRNLALGRAFEKLGKKLIKRANGKTKQNDIVRELKNDAELQTLNGLRKQMWESKKRQVLPTFYVDVSQSEVQDGGKVREKKKKKSSK